MKRKPLIVVLLGVLAALVAGSAWALHGKEASVPAAVEKKAADPDDLESFSKQKIFFGHQSVGANIITGIEATYNGPGKPTLTVVETRDDPPGSGGYLAHAPMGVNGDPDGKIVDFESVMNGKMGDAVDVAVLKLCYADITAGTDVNAVFQKYTAMMTRLEAAHPGVKFIYTTVPLTTDHSWKQTVKSWIGRDDQMGPADNVARQRYNELIRERYGDSGRLFDIAAVESTADTEPTERSHDGTTYYVLNRGLAADPGHLNELGARVAAAEFIDILAGQPSR